MHRYQQKKLDRQFESSRQKERKTDTQIVKKIFEHVTSVKKTMM